MRYALAVIFALLSWQATAQVETFTLSNGLQLLVKEDHRAPVVVSMVWYHVGSADEPSGISGVSHALEHLMFKGTKKYPLGVFSKNIAAIGGQENAFTNYDYTAFFEKTAASQLPISFEMEADRMQNLLLDKDEFAKEIKVIREERRQRTDDNPQALAFERFMAAAHLASPYQHPVVGWMEDLLHLTVNDAKAWYQNFYAPNNATLVVVGDVDAKKVYDLAKLYFGDIPRRPDFHRKPQAEPPSLGAKSIDVYAEAQFPALMFGFTVPSAKTAKVAWEPYALEIIAGVLNGGESARLPKNLIQNKHILLNGDVNYSPYSRYQTQFTVSGVPANPHTLPEVKAALLQELNQLKKTPLTAQELQRVKTQMLAQKTFEQDSIMTQAMELGLLETIGLSWREAETHTDKINAITPQQVMEVANRYFTEQSMTEAHLLPKKDKA